jgi:hypothetical protein
MKFPIVFFCITFVLYTALFVVGCWEASIAYHHEPTRDSSPGFLQGYVFTTLCAILNIMGAILMTCLLLFHDPKKNHDVTMCSWSCLVAIWGVILFVGMVNHDIYTGPFQIVVIVQFCITMVGTFICCSSCAGIMIVKMYTREDFTQDMVQV